MNLAPTLVPLGVLYARSMRGQLWVGLVLAVVGCGGDESCDLGKSQLRLTGVLAFEPGACTVDADGPLLANGVMDRLLTDRYVAMLKIENPGEADVAVRGASVVLSDTEGNSLREFTVDGGGLAKPGEAIASQAIVVPGPSGLPDHVIASITAEGETPSGTRVKSQALTFTVQLCSGCLIEYPVDAMDAATALCSRMPDEDLIEPCVFGQDTMVDCRLCAMTVAECLSP